MSTRVAILGTGKMGSAFARRLADVGTDIEIWLWNRTPARASAVGVGHVASTPAAAAANADIVLTSLTDKQAIRAAYLGSDGVLAAANGQLFVDMSTAGPDAIEEMAPLVEARGSRLIDAPVLGAPTRIAKGEAVVLAGGDDADIARARPILELFGDVRHVGPIGAGARVKLASNSMLAVITLAAAELQAAGTASGVDPTQVYWVLARLVPSLETRRAGYLEDRHEPALFALRDLIKDLDLAIGLFHRSGASVPVTALSRELMAEVAARDPGLGITAVVRRYQRDNPQASSTDTGRAPAPS